MSNDTTTKLGVVFAAAEAAPFSKTGGLGDVAGSLPQALRDAGCNVSVITPKYSFIPSQWLEKMDHVCDFYLNLGWRNPYCGIDHLSYDGVDFYFVDNEDYFRRDAPYGYFDDGERFAYFSKAVTESIKYLVDCVDGFSCNVLHCNDWQTALVPVFLREFYQGLPLYEGIKTVFTVHNVKFQGQYSEDVLNDVCGLAHIAPAAAQLSCGPRTINFMKGALCYSDWLTTVSPSYAEELKLPFYGEGMDGIFRSRASVLTGILNGIDVRGNDPATDKAIAATYSADDTAGKAVCKQAIQEELGLPVDPERPLMVMVSRLTKQKGLDLIQYALDALLSRNIQVVVLGTGDRAYEDSLRYFDWKYHENMRAIIAFDSALSKRLYAAADMFLMPSQFEPCGLSQMISMRYGTLPIVRETGGLRDTVIPYNQFTGEGTGFSFANFNGDEMRNCALEAAELFWTDKEAWKGLIHNAMSCDFSWNHAAEQYMEIYLRLCPQFAPEPEPEPEPAPEPKPKPKPAAKAKPAPEPKAEPKPEPKAEPAAAKPAAKKPVAAKKPAAKKPAATKTTAAKKPAATKATAAKTTTAKATTAAKKPAAKTTAAAAAKPATTAKKTASTTSKASTATMDKAATTAKKPAARKAAAPKTATTAAAKKTTTTKAATTTAKKAASGTKAAAPKAAPRKKSTTAAPKAPKTPGNEGA